ncbi:MAG: hypothetical protein KIT16_13135 [Rhodospirillaceae bacterium]|nr:hypothetical protein [Rhodospirillaceae bacterium]
MKTTLFAAAAALAATATPAAAYTNAYTTAPVYMRTGPDTAYPPVAVVPPNAPVIVYGCLGGWSWCDASWGPNRGWIAGMYLGAQYQNRPYPWTYAAPRYNVPIITFFFGNYWDTHYRGRPWYPQRDRWNRWDRDRRHWRR